MESIRLAFQGIWSHKLRSFLTMLGIIIGIASILTIVSTIEGANEQIKQNLIGSGNNVVTVQLYQDSNVYEPAYNGIPAGVKVIDPSLRREMEDLKSVEQVSLFTSRTHSDSITAGKAQFSGASYGIDDAYFSVMGMEVTYGRDFMQSDYDDFRKVVILDRKAAGILFPQEYPVGKSIEISGEPFTVIGIAEPLKAFTPTINSYQEYQMYMDTSGGAVYMPDTVWPVAYFFDEPQSVAVKAAGTDDITKAGQGVAKILNEHQIMTGASDSSTAESNPDSHLESTFSYRSEDLLQQAQKLQQMSSTTNRQLIWIASISLLVGGIGVMNIMLVSVTERTGEIGLKKALGAKKRRIRAQFLMEASVLTSIGGILGVGVGVLVASILAKTNEIPLVVSIPAAIVAVVFSTVIGLIFGLLPAMKAANLSPIEALRRD